MLNGEKIRVGVLRGGVGMEYNISLETGSYVLAHIPNEKYKAIDILVDRQGVWHKNGVSFSPDDIADYVDVVFNCLHGTDGEDGRIQKFLENKGVPFVGSDSLPSALTGYKNAAKDRLKAIGYQTPKYIVLKDLDKETDEKEKMNHIRRKAMEVFKKMPGPWIIKPILGSASTNTYLVTTFSELISILSFLSETFDEILVEEYINGREVAAAILDGFRNEEHYTMPIHEVFNKTKEEKNTGPRCLGTHRICVVGNDSLPKKKIEEMSKEIHKEFGLSDFSLIEYIISPNNDIYVIEVESVPLLSKNMPIHTILESVGLSSTDFIDHLISRNI
jgi:D-alanine-D-alanine ligase